MRRIGATIPVALVLTTVLMVASTLAATAVSDRELRRAKQFREDFGLTSSTRVVRESFAKPKLYPDRSNGVPLTLQEAAELDRRQAVFLAALPAIDVAKGLGGYAEMHLDQLNGGMPVFFYTGDIEARRDAIAEVMPEGIDFDVREVEFTSKQLRNKQRHVTQDMIEAGWALGDIPIVQVADGVVANRVMVGLLRAEDEERARAILQERYGPMVDVELIGRSQQDPIAGDPAAEPSESPPG